MVCLRHHAGPPSSTPALRACQFISLRDMPAPKPPCLPIQFDFCKPELPWNLFCRLASWAPQSSHLFRLSGQLVHYANQKMTLRQLQFRRKIYKDTYIFKVALLKKNLMEIKLTFGQVLNTKRLRENNIKATKSLYSQGWKQNGKGASRGKLHSVWWEKKKKIKTLISDKKIFWFWDTGVRPKSCHSGASDSHSPYGPHSLGA